MRFKSKLFFLAALLVLVGLPLVSQQGQLVNVSNFPATVEPTKVLVYSGTTLTNICITRPSGPWNNNSVPASFSWTRSASTLTSIVVSTNVGTVTTSTAHGLRPGNSVVVAGATVDTDLNGTYVIQTSASSTTFTITTVAVSNATYTDATMTLTTAAPRSTTAIWAVEKFFYDSSNNLVAALWAGGAPTYINICDNASTLSYR